MPIPSSPWTSLCHTRAGGVMSPGCDQGAPQTNSPNLAALAAALAAAAGPPTPGQRQQGRISDPGETSQQTWAEPIPQALPASPQGTPLRFSSSLSCPRTTPTPARLPDCPHPHLPPPHLGHLQHREPGHLLQEPGHPLLQGQREGLGLQLGKKRGRRSWMRRQGKMGVGGWIMR